jgi:succinate-semialdehyde dehydrogenase/glutarate-semialdehyde dehydrogenase
MSYSVPKLKDPSLFVGKNYVDGQWIESVSGKRFDVHGMSSNSNNHHIY